MRAALEITPGEGAAVAVEQVGDLSYQIIKLVLGGEGSAVYLSTGAGSVDGGVPRFTLAANDPAVAALALLSRPAVAPVQGVLNGAAAGTPFVPQRERPFNVTIWGTFAATVEIERSFDSGGLWHPLTAAGVRLYTLTAAASEILEEGEPGVWYRVRVSAHASGSVNYRLSQ